MTYHGWALHWKACECKIVWVSIYIWVTTEPGMHVCTHTHTHVVWSSPAMIDFFFSSTFAHFSYKLPRWVSFFPDGVSFCPEYHPQPLFFTQPSHTPLWDMYGHKTPTSPLIIPLFLAWIWKLAKWTTVWATWTRTEQNVWKVGKTFLEVGKKNFFIVQQPHTLDCDSRASSGSVCPVRPG